uniref:Cytochrome c-type biogenesis protein CcmH n=1 Tax=Candidatus Kentrum sp. FW TaxID=2126338 RepID=A0A450T8T2_9GAMM|nr:MAG: cytochrome c-type biogenesis protein CcmH [Candidatus Kentron sp. FW]
MIGTFLFIAMIMIGTGLVFVLPAILGRSGNMAYDRKRFNAEIYRERIAELDRQHRDKKIDDAEFTRFRDEIRQSAFSDLAEDNVSGVRKDSAGFSNKFIALVVTLAMPIAAFGLYFQLGRPDILVGGEEIGSPQEISHRSSESGRQPSIMEMIERLALRLREDPDDLEGWLMLGRSYTMLGRLDEARTAFAKAYERWPDNPEILISYAESLAGHNEGNLVGKPSELIQSALRIDPDLPAALWLAGVAAYQQHRPGDAIRYWERLQKKGEISGQDQEILTKALAEARQMIEENRKTDEGPD